MGAEPHAESRCLMEKETSQESPVNRPDSVRYSYEYLFKKRFNRKITFILDYYKQL